MQIDNKYNDWLLLYFYESTDNLDVIKRNDFEIRLATSDHACYVDTNIVFSKYEKVDLLLKDGRILRNTLLFKGKYVSTIFRDVANGFVARDRLSNYAISLYPTIFDKFDFQAKDIKEIRNQPDNIKYYFFGLIRRCKALKEQEIETWMDNSNKTK
ncbi:hypothetical protein [Carboxylicivirga taeanensis]|uniref:hypothetical protein n=1 Tax=Carboxylicivirga taeanensis TaxID=1416875 RepID=UPI003F6DF3AD